LNAGWDEELLRTELLALQDQDYDLDVIGFEPADLDRLLAIPEGGDVADQAPPLPEVAISRPGDLWLCGEDRRQHRVLCGDATDAATVANLLVSRKPKLMVTDPPYGIELDSEWRDRAGLNGCGAAEPSYMKRRSKGHQNTTISEDTRADWSEAFALVPSLEVAYVWHASKFTREVLDGLLRIEFLHHQQIIWNKGRTVSTRTHTGSSTNPAGTCGKRTLRGSGRLGRTPQCGIRLFPKFIMGGSGDRSF
jgi:hypothetical protein